MTDLTLFFNQCVQIYNEGNQEIIQRKQKHREQQQQQQKQKGIGPNASSDGVNNLYVKDTFNKECKELYNEIIGLGGLVASVKPSYLLSMNALKDYATDSDDDNDESEYDDEDEDEDLDDLNYVPSSTKSRASTAAAATVGSKKAKIKKPIKANFTEEERDMFDSQSNLLLHKFNQKLNHLENYESKRSENLWFSKEFNNTDLNQHQQDTTIGSRFALVKNYITFTFKKEDYQNLNKTIHSHREGMLSSLSQQLKKISTELGNMQSVRLNRKLEEKSNELHLLNNNDLSEQIAVAQAAKDAMSKNLENRDTNNSNNLASAGLGSNDPAADTAPTLSYNEQLQIDNNDDENLREYQSTISSLSQTQLKKLELENSELLSNKLNELQKVKNLQKSASDIANLQRELSIHVETQAEQIKSLQDDQEMAEMDVLKGNRELKSAKLKSRRSSLIIIWASVILGFLLLFFDAVII